MNKEIPDCPICGTPFENIFEATDHLLDDEGEQPFDPKLILPNGYSLMVGSLLRALYGYSDDPTQIKRITQDTYATLYAAEVDPGQMKHFVEDMIVSEHMSVIDEELKELLEKNNDNESGE